MTISTRRIFTASPAGAQVTESVKLSQSAAARALAAQTSRLSNSADRQQQAAAVAQQTAFYRGQGEYSTLGADGQYRPRGSTTSGGVPIGQQVPASGGLMGGMPAGDGGDLAALRTIQERVAEVAQSAGPQIGTLDPNVSEASPRYPQDHYYQSGPGVLWQWRTTAGAEAGEWIVICGVIEQIDIPIDRPESRAYVLCQNQRYTIEIVALHTPPGLGYTATVSPGPGGIVAVGETITLTLSAVPSNAASTAFSVETRRV